MSYDNFSLTWFYNLLLQRMLLIIKMSIHKNLWKIILKA